MGRQFEVRYEAELPAAPGVVWDAVTVHTGGWLWPIDYEPRVGGATRGLDEGGGTVVAWVPERRFATRSERPDGWFNQLDYDLEPVAAGTYLRYRHTGVLPAADYARELDACRRHTDLYYHSLGEYVRHFAGRDAAYLSLDAPEGRSFADLLGALGVGEDAAVGDRVRLGGPEPVDGVIDYRTAEFVGVRSEDALYRFYGRDRWGWPVGVAHHLFAPSADPEGAEASWRVWLDGVTV